MSSSPPNLVGRVLYGALFVLLVPAALVLWAWATRGHVPLPVPAAPGWGLGLLGAGALLMGVGMLNLLLLGGGLPMNAFPPPRYVARGAYGLVGHPIYVGFGLGVAGAALLAGSASGLWLVTPATWLAMAALVWGHERPDLRRRFGAVAHRPLLSLPADGPGRPRLRERAVVFGGLLLALAVHEALHRLLPASTAWDALLPVERGLPLIPWAGALFLAGGVWVGAAPWATGSRRRLHRFAVAGAWALAVTTFLHLVVPVQATPRGVGCAWFSQDGAASVPAILPLWTWLSVPLWPRLLRPLAWVAAAVVSLAAVASGQHGAVGVAAAGGLALLFHHHRAVWAALRAGAERVANSWREWRFGPVRLLNRAFWVATGGGLGMALALSAAGPEWVPALAGVAIASLVGAALWAQWLEGSDLLLRPFGFYGGLLGGLVGTAGAAALGYDPVRILAAFAVGLPWAQALGRGGCLVQGCCHGGPDHPAVGIRYRHNRSRVTRIAGLVNVPLSPTPLYSFLSNLVIGAVLIRLWAVGATPGMVLGLYFFLSGLARFVEESYRAEPQTRVVAGLHVYHWLAVASVVGGAAATALPQAAPPVAFHPLDPVMGATAAGVALYALAMMGVDFPGSNRRFSRLAPADGAAALLEEAPAAPAPGEGTPQRRAG